MRARGVSIASTHPIAAPKKLWSFLRSYTTWFWTRRRLIMQMGRKEWYAFKKEMAPRYVKFHEALAAGDGHAIRSLMTEPGYNVRMPDRQICVRS